MLGQPADVFFTPEDRETGIAAEEMRSALATGRGADERWHIRKDGQRFWANGEMMALRDGTGTAIGFVKILRDRTQERVAAAALAASEATLRTVLDTIPVGILVAESPSGRIIGSNARSCQSLAMTSFHPNPASVRRDGSRSTQTGVVSSLTNGRSSRSPAMESIRPSWRSSISAATATRLDRHRRCADAGRGWPAGWRRRCRGRHRRTQESRGAARAARL